MNRNQKVNYIADLILFLRKSFLVPKPSLDYTFGFWDAFKIVYESPIDFDSNDNFIVKYNPNLRTVNDINIIDFKVNDIEYRLTYNLVNARCLIFKN